MEKALFSFKKYCFNDIHLCLSDSDSDDKSLDLKFDPMGVFHSKTKTFELTLQFKAITSKQHKEIISIKCVAEFVFMDDVNTLEKIPEFFYANSIAIIFPYIRSFVSTLTLQANYAPLVLETMNLTSLRQKFKENTTISKE